MSLQSWLNEYRTTFLNRERSCLYITISTKAGRNIIAFTKQAGDGDDGGDGDVWDTPYLCHRQNSSVTVTPVMPEA